MLYHLILYQTGNDGLGRHVVHAVADQLDAEIRTPPEETQIDLWLDSPGGDAHATYKIYLEIRSRCNRFRAVVPDYAKSAATLLVLGADSVLMGPTAELGPLDAQMEHPDREGKIVSALDAARAINYLVELAIDLALTSGPQFLQFTGLPRSDVLHELLQFMARFLDPMVAKLDPQLVHHARNDLRVAEEYAVRLLRDQQGRRNHGAGELDPEQLASILVSRYPEHGFVISRDELSALGLTVEHAEEHPRWSKFKSLNRMVYREHQATFLKVFSDSELDENKQGSNNDDKGTEDTSQASA